MSDVMSEYEVDITPEDIGEILTIIRVQHLKMHRTPFANKMGIKENVLDQLEEGKGFYVFNAIKKINKIFPTVEITLNVKFKKGV